MTHGAAGNPMNPAVLVVGALWHCAQGNAGAAVGWAWRIGFHAISPSSGMVEIYTYGGLQGRGADLVTLRAQARSNEDAESAGQSAHGRRRLSTTPSTGPRNQAQVGKRSREQPTPQPRRSTPPPTPPHTSPTPPPASPSSAPAIPLAQRSPRQPHAAAHPSAVRARWSTGG